MYRKNLHCNLGLFWCMSVIPHHLLLGQTMVIIIIVFSEHFPVCILSLLIEQLIQLSHTTRPEDCDNKQRSCWLGKVKSPRAFVWIIIRESSHKSTYLASILDCRNRRSNHRLRIQHPPLVARFPVIVRSARDSELQTT